MTAVYLVRRYRARTGRVTPAVTDLHTGEFVALRDAVLAEHHRRTAELHRRAGELQLAT